MPQFIDTYVAASERLMTLRKGKKGKRRTPSNQLSHLFRSLNDVERHALENGNQPPFASIARISSVTDISVEECKRQFDLLLYWRSNSMGFHRGE